MTRFLLLLALGAAAGPALAAADPNTQPSATAAAQAIPPSCQGAARHTLGCQRKLAAALDARERTHEARRWALRKRMCRELGVRFDSSGLCW